MDGKENVGTKVSIRNTQFLGKLFFSVSQRKKAGASLIYIGKLTDIVMLL